MTGFFLLQQIILTTWLKCSHQQYSSYRLHQGGDPWIGIMWMSSLTFGLFSPPGSETTEYRARQHQKLISSVKYVEILIRKKQQWQSISTLCIKNKNVKCVTATATEVFQHVSKEHSKNIKEDNSCKSGEHTEICLCFILKENVWMSEA